MDDGLLLHETKATHQTRRSKPSVESSPHPPAATIEHGHELRSPAATQSLMQTAPEPSRYIVNGPNDSGIDVRSRRSGHQTAKEASTDCFPFPADAAPPTPMYKADSAENYLFIHMDGNTSGPTSDGTVGTYQSWMDWDDNV
jgi:hypothetical protein